MTYICLRQLYEYAYFKKHMKCVTIFVISQKKEYFINIRFISLRIAASVLRCTCVVRNIAIYVTYDIEFIEFSHILI